MERVIKLTGTAGQTIKRKPGYMDVQPQHLLPILNYWKAADKEKYSTLVAMICCSADTDPETLIKGRRTQWHK